MANYTYEELAGLANAVRNVWQDAYAGTLLPGMSKQIRSTGNKAYQALIGDVIEIAGGNIFSGNPLRAIISMKDFGVEEAMRIQTGYGPFDMKPGFLKSPKARTSKPDKDGKTTKYMFISFRHTTPGATGDLGSPMTPSVHRAAKRGMSFEDQTGTKADPSDFGLINSKDYAWQNGPLAGITNIRDEAGRHSQFRTFRVVSENSDPNSWWHPGVDANDIIGSTVKYVEPYIKEGLKRAAKAEVITKLKEIFDQPV